MCNATSEIIEPISMPRMHDVNKAIHPGWIWIYRSLKHFRIRSYFISDNVFARTYLCTNCFTTARVLQKTSMCQPCPPSKASSSLICLIVVPLSTRMLTMVKKDTGTVVTTAKAISFKRLQSQRGDKARLMYMKWAYQLLAKHWISIRRLSLQPVFTTISTSAWNAIRRQRINAWCVEAW